MAHPDLNFIPLAAAQAFVEGNERQAISLLRREQSALPVGGAAWAWLERLIGLLLIHMQREVEGTFCLDRADAVLDALPVQLPQLDWLKRRAGHHSADEGAADSGALESEG